MQKLTKDFKLQTICDICYRDCQGSISTILEGNNEHTACTRMNATHKMRCDEVLRNKFKYLSQKVQNDTTIKS